jgi:hypothetical protein
VGRMKLGNRVKGLGNMPISGKGRHIYRRDAGREQRRPDSLWHGTSYKVVPDGMVEGHREDLITDAR